MEDENLETPRLYKHGIRPRPPWPGLSSGTFHPYLHERMPNGASNLPSASADIKEPD